MHSTTLHSGQQVHHNGDFSGDVKFSFPKVARKDVIEDHATGDFTITLRMEDLEELVGIKTLRDGIARLEDAHPLDLVRRWELI